MVGVGSHETELLLGQNWVLELMAQGASLRRILDLLLRLVQAQCPGMLCSILLMDRDGVHLRHGSAPDLPEAYTRFVDGIAIGPQVGSCGTAAYRRAPVIVSDIETDLLWKDYRDVALRFALRACWSTPIYDGSRRLLGTFAMYFGTPMYPDEKHVVLTELATHIASIAISRHRTEEDMKTRQALLLEALQMAGAGSYEWDPVTRQLQASDEMCRIFGLSPEEFPRSFDGYFVKVHPEDRPNTERIIELSLREGQSFDFEERIIRPDESTRIVRSQGRWFLDEARQPMRLVGICQDITDRKEAEEQLRRANEALRQLRMPGTTSSSATT